MTKDDEDDEFTRIEMEQRMRQEWTPNDMACRPNGLAQTAQGIRPVESDYLSHVAYTRALEVYCDNLEKPAQPAQRPWVEIEESDMPDGENSMFDHPYFIAGMVYANKILKEKNNGT